MNISAECTPFEQKKNYLLSLGTPEELLAEMLPERLVEVYNSVIENLIDGQTVEFGEYKTESGLSDVMARGQIPSNQFTITTYNYVYSTNNLLNYVSVFFDWDWKIAPVNQKTDGLSVNWNASVFSYKPNSLISRTFFHSDYDTVHPVDYYETYATVLNFAEAGQGSGAWKQPLGKLGHNRGSGLLLLVPNAAMNKTGYTRSQFNIEYSHDKNPLPGDFLSFSFKAGVVSISSGLLVDKLSATTNIIY